MRQYSLFITICILMAAAVLLNVACNNQKKIAEKKTAEQVKKAFEANYRIEKTADGYRLGGMLFNGTAKATVSVNGWTFIINQKKKRTIEITAPGVGTAKFRFDNSGNLTDW